MTSCLRLLKTERMLRLSLAFLYTGLEISYWAGVLPSSVSFTTALGEDRQDSILCNKIVVCFEQKIASNSILYWIILSKALGPV